MHEIERGMVASSFDVHPKLVEYLPFLTDGQLDLGVPADAVVSLLSAIDRLPEEGIGLDLACGRGHVACQLAATFGWSMHGVDLVAEFIADANSLATRMNLAEEHRASSGESARGAAAFEVGEARAFAEACVAREETFDVVCLLGAVGLFGDAADTVDTLRMLTSPGGVFVFDEPWCDPERGEVSAEIPRMDELIAVVEEAGDRVAAVAEVDGPEDRERLEELVRRVERRARTLAQRHPGLAGPLKKHVAGLYRGLDVLDGPVVGGVWVVERGD